MSTETTTKPPEKNRRRQWGTEKQVFFLPTVHQRPTPWKLALSRLAILVTVLSWLAYVITTIIRQFIEGESTSFRFTMEAIGYLVIVTLLSLSALMYLIAREGALARFSEHERTPRIKLDQHFATHSPSITALIPSYAEEPHVVRTTLISAALQEYANMRLVLLIDDPPFPSNPAVLDRLNATRDLAGELETLLSGPADRFTEARRLFNENAGTTNSHCTAEEVSALANQFDWAAHWLKNLAAHEPINDHVDEFLSVEIYLSLAEDFEQTGAALLDSLNAHEILCRERADQLYQRLTSVFTAKISYFERKRFLSTSHEANKAMNLNSYIRLMGGTYQPVRTRQGTLLEPDPQGSLEIPDSDYLLTLDADSILLKEYCLRLVYLMEQEENQRVAVAQTPYSSFRGAPTRIERLAGATTDLQHIQHQGLTKYGATFWVGANAVIRKQAIEEIGENDVERGFPITRYIQDRTVIEDTESSIDMVAHGWTLVNYPERLSYSATPPDFGSLVVQRRRWANGGLIILTKFLAQLGERRRLRQHIDWVGVMLRFNYMASIAWASFGLIFLLAYPYDGRLLSPLVVVTALPYFLSMAADLHYSGYRRTDALRIYGFNLILLPVNLAGVLTSAGQGLTGRKIPFARTPKVKDRTLSPAMYIIIPLFIIGFSLFTLYRDAMAQNWGNAAFAGFNALLTTWAFVSYIGIGHGFVDMWMGLWRFITVERPHSGASAPAKPIVNQAWKEVLEVGVPTLSTTGGTRDRK